MIIKTDEFCKQVIFRGIQTVPAVNEAETVFSLLDYLGQKCAIELAGHRHAYQSSHVLHAPHPHEVPVVTTPRLAVEDLQL